MTNNAANTAKYRETAIATKGISHAARQDRTKRLNHQISQYSDMEKRAQKQAKRDVDDPIPKPFWKNRKRKTKTTI